MTKVAVEIWEMDSDPGYVPSSGWSEVYLIPTEQAAQFGPENEESLFDLVTDMALGLESISEDQASEVEPYERHRGVCNYTGFTGIFEVPEGFVAVEVQYENISTWDEPHARAKILNQDSLIHLYEERIKKYTDLAAAAKALRDKRIGFGEFKRIVDES